MDEAEGDDEDHRLHEHLAHVSVDGEESEHEENGRDATLQQRKGDRHKRASNPLSNCGRRVGDARIVVVEGDVGGEVDGEADGPASTIDSLEENLT